MGTEWGKTTLGELIDSRGAEVKTGPFGTKLKAAEYTEFGAPLISVREIQIGRIVVEEKTPCVPEEVQRRMPEYLLREGDIVFARKGGIDRSAYVTKHQVGYFMGSDALRVRLPKSISSRFVAYQAQSRQMRAWLLQNATGSTMPSLSGGILKRMPIVLPPLDEQKRIAAVLGALDDKIELNRKMNQTLEEMAQAIFKSWFIDFDGVPDEDLVDSELGPIPREWRVGVLEDHLVLQRGFDLPKKQRALGSVPILAAGGLNGTHSEAKVAAPGVVTGRSGKLGDVYLILEDFWPLNTTLWVKDFRNAGAFFAFHLLRTLDLARFNAGSAVPTLNRNHVHGLPLVVPPIERVSEFEEVCEALFKKRAHNNDESATLAELRDTLLPKLISGEIRVPEAEEQLEAAQ